MHIYQGEIMSDSVDTVEFVYKKEFWYVSAFLNEKFIDGANKAKEIQDLVISRISSITSDDLKRVRSDEVKSTIIEMGKNASIVCRWVPYIQNFPYLDENTEKEYNTLGYFQFEVEYFKDQEDRKIEINPLMIQQIPFIVLAKLAEFENRPENKFLNIDNESPIYVFVISNKTMPEEIPWSQGNIEKYKYSIGNWTEIYSGAWSDYNESIYDKRIQKNLSNRLSELHFIRRNSGFIYMADENYKTQFDSYMIQFVLDPTPRIRTILYALMSINHSLDLLFSKVSSPFGLIDVDIIEQKLANLRYLRGAVQTNLSAIYDELDYNRRQHYTAVLTHLINEFQLDRRIERIENKFETIYNAMTELYQNKNEEAEKRTQRGLGMLNVLFGLSIIDTLASRIIESINGTIGDIAWFISMIVIVIIAGLGIITIQTILKGKIDAKKAGASYTVDAVIVDGRGNVLLQKRSYPPFKGFYALPGGFLEQNEKHHDAILRIVKDEVHVKVHIDKKVGVYDKKGRDPRGNVISTAYKCTVTGDLDKSQLETIPYTKVKELKLAFDHKKILDDAGVI